MGSNVSFYDNNKLDDRGAEIVISVTNYVTASNETNNITNCEEEAGVFKPGLLKQEESALGLRCFVKFSNSRYEYNIKRIPNAYSISLRLGILNNDEENKIAISTFKAVAASIKPK